jgi:hypothetical protein
MRRLTVAMLISSRRHHIGETFVQAFTITAHHYSIFLLCNGLDPAFDCSGYDFFKVPRNR